MMGHRTQLFRRGDKVRHRERPDIPGMVMKVHDREPHEVPQYVVEWERSPYGYGKRRLTHEWQDQLQVA